MKHLGKGEVERQQLHECHFHSVPVGGLGSNFSLVIHMPTGVYISSRHCKPAPHSEFRTLNESENSIHPCTLHKEAEYFLQIPCSLPIVERGFLCPLYLIVHWYKIY